MSNEDSFNNRFNGMNLMQMIAIRMLEQAAARVRDICGGTVWLSVALPTGVEDERGRGMILQTYAISCECPVCTEVNNKVVREIQAVVERVAGIDHEIVTSGETPRAPAESIDVANPGEEHGA